MGWLQLFHCLPAVRSDKTARIKTLQPTAK
uniref:Uncharacterized protein n=1 Tax=Anguilla anguilla TaxID=7936 RepID=A0A0E9VQP5_ANGAN